MQEVLDLIERTHVAIAANRDAAQPDPAACAQVVAFSRTWHLACRTTESQGHWHRFVELIADSAVTRDERQRTRLITQALEAALDALRSEVRYLKSEQSRFPREDVPPSE